MVTFEKAKENETLRQAYLDSFLNENPSDNVSHLRYNLHRKAGLDHVSELQFSGSIDTESADELREIVYKSNQYAFLLLTPSMIGRGDRHPIIVNPRAFEELSEDAFRYNIKYHEFVHALDFRYGILLPNGVVVNHTNAEQLQSETLEALVETRALIYQIMRGRKLGLADSEAFMNAIHGFLKYHHQLKNVQPENDFERDVIAIQIKSYQGMFQEDLRGK